MKGEFIWPDFENRAEDDKIFLTWPAWQDLDKGKLQETADDMGKLHTDDTFMYQNRLVGDLEEAYDTLTEYFDPLEEMVRNAEELDLYDDGIVHDLTKPLSQQIGGEHYRQGNIQPIEYIHANDMDFFSGNVVKYITRWKYKSGLEDLQKAKHYIELLIEQEYGNGYHG